jgi:predicted nucleic acid-binding protein
VTILIDSDVLIEITRAQDAALVSTWERLADSDAVLLCSPVTVAELWHGARPAEHAVLNALFESLICVPVDQAIGRMAGEYLRQYHKNHNVELGDAIIAATASIHGATLWTRNRKHYPMKDVPFFR